MLSPENQSWHNALPLPKSSQVFIALLQLSLGFQIFLLKLLSHLQIMLDQTVPLNIQCQMVLNLLFLQAAGLSSRTAESRHISLTACRLD